MRSLFLTCIALSLTPVTASAQHHPEARRAYEEHWRAHPETAEILIRDWHRRFFRRDCPAPLLARWSRELREGIEPALAIGHILASPEYYETVGRTPEGFVRRTFVEIVGRQPTEPEFHFWLHRLYRTDRAEVASEIVTRYPPAWVAVAPPVEHYEYRPPVVHYHH